MHILFVDDLNPAAVTLVYETHYSSKRNIWSFRIFQSCPDIFVFIGCSLCGICGPQTPHYSNLIGLPISGWKACLNIISGSALVVSLVSILSVFQSCSSRILRMGFTGSESKFEVICGRYDSGGAIEKMTVHIVADFCYLVRNSSMYK